MAEPIFDETHTATGQMAGYLFQPDRALVILCSCKNNESVSIELIDDVAIVDETGDIVYREQDKSSIQEAGQPYKDRSKDLWNTLKIWIDAAKNGSLSPDSTKLVCVSNKKLNDNALIHKISFAETAEQIEVALTLLKSAAQKPPTTLKSITEDVLKEEDVLKKIIPQITLLDDNNLQNRNEVIAHELNLNDNIKENVITDLRGWLQESVLLQLDAGNAPVISKVDFNNRLQRAIQKESDDRITMMAKRFVKSKIRKEEIDEAIDKPFVKQLELLGHYDKQNIIIDAIDDFLCSETERVRLVLKGDLQKDELEAIDDLSRERWKEVFRRKMTGYNVSMGADEMGRIAYEIFDNTVHGYLAKIRGFETEPYFTKGSFHKLADELEIGWHPEWQKHFPK